MNLKHNSYSRITPCVDILSGIRVPYSCLACLINELINKINRNKALGFQNKSICTWSCSWITPCVDNPLNNGACRRLCRTSLWIHSWSLIGTGVSGRLCAWYPCAVDHTALKSFYKKTAKEGYTVDLSEATFSSFSAICKEAMSVWLEGVWLVKD